MKSTLIKKYGSESRWVSWRLETVKGKVTKVPYIAGTNKKAATDNPTTWTTFNKIKEENIGIVLHDQLLICIDIDHVLTNGKLQSEHNETIAELILEADTYTEISQSGTGLHLFLALTEPLTLTANKKAPFEVYNKVRFICTTGKSYREEREVRTITPEEALEIIKKIVPQKEPETINTIIGTSTISDEELLKKMFYSSNGDKVKALFDGDTSNHGGDESSADMAICSHLAFWTGRDPIQMERIWLSSSLGKREKMKRKDYRTRTISAAIKNCKETYKTPETKDLDLLFIMTGKDKDIKVFTLNTENICRVLDRHKDFSGTIRYDKFKNKLEVKKNGIWEEFGEADEIVIQTKISILFPCFAKVNKQMVFDAIVKVAKDNAIDSATDYLKSLNWDKVPRIDHWLEYTYGVPNDEYHNAVASNWLKGLVKRIVIPGSKFDYVLVLEGEQGVKKSTSLAVLGGDWYVETSMSTDSKDFFMLFTGKAIIEFSEGETLSRTEVKRMKAIITTQHDRYRLPYGRTTQDFPRRCVFAMTTNEAEYLKDETGNRRWLPVATKFPESNIDWLMENRDQLFAEAYHRAIILKETTYEFPIEATLEAQASRMVSDPNTDLVSEWYYTVLTDTDRANGITPHRVFNECLHKNFTTSPMKKWEEMMVINILKKHLGLKKKRMMINGVQANRWFGQMLEIPTEKEIEQSEIIF